MIVLYKIPLNFTITVWNSRFLDCNVINLVQIPSINHEPAKYEKNQFASVVEYLFSEEVDPSKVRKEGGHMLYKLNRPNMEEIKMRISDIGSFYTNVRDDAVGALKNTINEKVVKPVSGIIHYKKGNDTRSISYDFDEFMEHLGPTSLKYVNQAITDLKFNNMPIKVSASFDQMGNYMDAEVIPLARSEPLGSKPYDSKVIGHDFGEGAINEIAEYGKPTHKGY